MAKAQNIFEQGNKVGIVGSQTTFLCTLREPITGELIDDEDFVGSGALPKVQVFDETGTKIYDTKIDGEDNLPTAKIERQSLGKYLFTFLVPSGSTITLGDPSLNFITRFTFKIAGVTNPLDILWDTSTNFKHSFKGQDTRIGFMFGNPDVNSDHYAPGWGRLITPDEIRSGLFFGNEMAAQNGDFFYRGDDTMVYR